MKQYILYFILYCVLHYIEGFPPVFGLPIAQLWKLPLLFYLLLFSVTSLRRRYSFEKNAYSLAIESTLNVETLLNPIYSLVHAIKQLPLVLLFRYWLVKFSHRWQLLEVFLYSLAQFILLSSLIVLLGIVSPIKGFETTDVFGVENTIYYSGLLGDPHAAASYFAAAILVLLNGLRQRYFKTLFQKIFNVLLILVGLVSIFEAYVRTGWLMLFVGGMVLMMPKKITIQHIFRSLFGLIIVIAALFYFYQTNEKFQARIIGQNVYASQTAEGIDMKGSGRTSFWLNGIEGWSQGNLYEVFFGKGWTKVVDYNFEKTGMRVFSHNQFVNFLVEHGVFGLFFLLAFYFSIYRLLRTNRASPYYSLTLSLLVAAIIFSFFQSEMYFDFSILFSLSLALFILSRGRAIDRSQQQNL